MIYKIILSIFIAFVFFSPKAVGAANVKVPILMYHFIGNNPNPADKARDTLSVNPDKFEKQMDYLARNGYTTISLDTMFAIFSNQVQAPAKPVVLTFDDGYIDFYFNAYPILKRYNMKAVSFIPTGLIGQGYYMNWNQIKEIQQSGVATFEAHSITHSNLANLSSERLTKELQESKRVLYEQTGYPVNFVAYPFGISNANVIIAAKNAGYVGGLGTWNGKPASNSMNMPRIRITGQMDLRTFASKL